MTAFGNLDCTRQSFGQIGKEARHLSLCLEIMFRRQLPTIRLTHHPALGNGDQHIMALIILTGGEERFIGRHKRQATLIGLRNEKILGPRLFLAAMAL